MKKSITVTIIVVMSIMLLAGLGVLTWMLVSPPFTIDKYLEEVEEGKNLTMEYEWDLMGAVTRDVYEFDDGNMRRLHTSEMVTSRNNEGDYETFHYIYNVWYKDITVDEETYLKAIGFGDKGGGLGDEFATDSPKKEGINMASAVLALARESLSEAFEMDTDSFVLKQEHYADIFGIDFENTSDILVEISLNNGEIVLNMEYGSYSFVLTISDLGSTKVKITDEMRNGRSGFSVY